MDDSPDASIEERALSRLDTLDPKGLRECCEQHLRGCDWLPATLAVAVAHETGAEHDAVERAADVHLIVAGLLATDDLAVSPPWLDADSEAEKIDADIDLLAAEVLVARGFEGLAGTPAAPAAVGAVREFASERTRAPESKAADGDSVAVALCRLGVTAGCAEGVKPADECGATALDLAGGLSEPVTGTDVSLLVQ